jgi:hypothetical protein
MPTQQIKQYARESSMGIVGLPQNIKEQSPLYKSPLRLMEEERMVMSSFKTPVKMYEPIKIDPILPKYEYKLPRYEPIKIDPILPKYEYKLPKYEPVKPILPVYEPLKYEFPKYEPPLIINDYGLNKKSFL